MVKKQTARQKAATLPVLYPSGRRRGEVVHWIPARGFGFIRDFETGRKVFVHHTRLRDAPGGWRDLTVHQVVEYEWGAGTADGPQALDVIVIADRSLREATR